MLSYSRRACSQAPGRVRHMDIVAIVTVGFLVIGLAMVLRRRGGVGKAAKVRGVDLNTVTGIVSGSGRHSETVVSGSGSGVQGGPVSLDVRSHSVLHQNFFLRREDGVEEPVKMWGLDVPLADGQKVTLIRASRGGLTRYSSLINHNARRAWPLYTDAAQVAEHLAVVPKPLVALLFAVIGAAVGSYIVVEVIMSNYQRVPIWPVALPLFVLAWLFFFIRRRSAAMALNHAITRCANEVLEELNTSQKARA